MATPIKAHPLTWPMGWKRTEAYARRRAQFGRVRFIAGAAPGQGWNSKGDLSVAEAVARVQAELRRMGAPSDDIVISTNLVLRLDGLPRSDQRTPTDPGAAVYWVGRDAGAPPRCMAIDQYDKVEHNLAAIAEILDRAFTGFTALPPPVVAQRPWREVLEIAPSEKRQEVVLNGYRRLRSDRHPDKPGGSHEAFLAVQQAYEQACRELGVPL
jgi:hypothetical protein